MHRAGFYGARGPRWQDSALEFARLIEEFCRLHLPEIEKSEGKDMRLGDLVSKKAEGRFEVAGRMANAIVEIMREQGGCMPQDLAAKGFTPEEIDRLWAMAKALAMVELNINDA